MALTASGTGCKEKPGATGSMSPAAHPIAIGIALLGGYYLLRILLEAKSVHPLEDYIIRGLVPNVVLCLVGLWALWRVDRV